MKKIFLVFSLVLLTFWGCEKNPVSKPSIKIQDLYGTWVSLDSSLIKNEKGEYVYINDTFLFTPDTFTCENGQKASPVLHRTGTKFVDFQVSIKEVDTLVLDYIGAIKILHKSKHKIEIKDSILTVNNPLDIYGVSYFDQYRRIK